MIVCALELHNLLDLKEIDNYFTPQTSKSFTPKPKRFTRANIIKTIKLALPSLAALFIALLIIIPQLKNDISDIASSSIVPKKGELEKFHMENGAFYITDNKNTVNNFHAETLDETEAGSKIIKMIKPQGTLPNTKQEEIKISAPIGYYNQNNKLLTLQQGVNIDYSTGVIAKTEEIHVDFNTGKAYGNHPITTTSNDAKIQAQGFEYYKDKNLLIYTGKNHTVINTENIDGGI